ncbi:MAG: hypothetical protein KC636_38130, partial [Myxococcales bacterium]|nr:hypothetical protein [Myxococcales bacterium]
DGDGLPMCEALTLIHAPGVVFTASPDAPLMILKTPAPPLRRIEVDVDVHIAEFRKDIPPNNEERWDHVFYGLNRDNQPSGFQRYLLGASARIETNAADRAFNYGRVDIAMGAESYISWKKSYPWAEQTDVHLHQVIDADSDEQLLQIFEGGEMTANIAGPVPFFDPTLTEDGLFLELGTEDADWGLHVSPHGWTFSNVRLCGWER